MHNKTDWSNEPRQEQAVGQALCAALAFFTFFGLLAWAAEFIGSLF